MKVTKQSLRKREENVTETKTEKIRIFVNFWSDFWDAVGDISMYFAKSVAMCAALFEVVVVLVYGARLRRKRLQ